MQTHAYVKGSATHLLQIDGVDQAKRFVIMHSCHKNAPSTLLLCDDLSGEDHDNVSPNKEFGGHILMKILVLPRPIEGVPREEVLQQAAAEIQAVWELYVMSEERAE